MRSRQTGQVGNSTNEGVGGARGFVVSEFEVKEGFLTGGAGDALYVNGSLLF